MSHFTIETPIRNIAAVREACQEVGVELIEHAVARWVIDLSSIAV